MSIDFKERSIEIVKRAKNGEIFANIARDLGISRERVRQIVKKHGNITGRELQHSGERPAKATSTNCVNCKKQIIILRRSNNPRGKKFCSKDCMGEYLQKNKDISERKHFASQKYPRKIYKRTYLGIVNGEKKYVYTHRYIMEKHLGRKLKKSEHVHHINGNGLDNRIENLVVMTKYSHASLTGKQIWGKKEDRTQKEEVIYIKPKDI